MPFELPGYEIIEELHRGRKTVVYRATRNKDHHPVVIKAIRPDEASPFDAVRLHHEHETMQRADFIGVVRSTESNIITIYMPLFWRTSAARH